MPTTRRNSLKLYLVLLVLASVLPTTFCNASNCDFYSKLNSKHHCKASNNYLLTYGQKYCNQFTNLEIDSASSKKLKKWIGQTKICLQEMLEESKARHRWQCPVLKEFAFDVHPVCYKVYGICNLTKSDITKIAKVIVKNDFITDFEKEKRATVMQIANVGTSCLAASETLSVTGELFYNLIIKSKVNFTGNAISWAIEIIDRAPDTLMKMENYFSKVIASMTSSNEEKREGVSSNSIKDFSRMASDRKANFYDFAMARKVPVGVSQEEINAVRSKLLSGLSTADLKRGLEKARELTSVAK